MVKPKYEYEVSTSVERSGLKAELNSKARDGWEPFQIVHTETIGRGASIREYFVIVFRKEVDGRA